MSYRTQILDYLMTGDTLDPIKALNLFGCFALSQRITDLKKEGIPVKMQMVTAKSGKRHAIYWLEPDYIHNQKEQAV